MQRPITDDVVKTDTVEQPHYYVPTVHDILEQRQELKYALWCDSVYLQMPEQILTHLLVTKGTTQSITEIVEDYMSNKDYYHDTILRAMNVQRKYIPDSLPKSSIPNKESKQKDTIPIYDK
jgi:hypothetical protein